MSKQEERIRAEKRQAQLMKEWNNRGAPVGSKRTTDHLPVVRLAELDRQAEGGQDWGKYVPLLLAALVTIILILALRP